MPRLLIVGNPLIYARRRLGILPKAAHNTRMSNLSTDLQGTGRLAIEAITGVVDIVESLHQTIATAQGIFAATDARRTRGITGLVYGNIRGVTNLVGKGIDLPLGLIAPLLGEQESSPKRDAVLSALNGTIGDHLAAKNNPLAIPMRFRQNSKLLDDQALLKIIREVNGRLAILVHGAFRNNLGWNRNGHDHGAALARDLGLAPIYLHYNTGLHISTNGREFSALLQHICDLAKRPLEFTIIAHSMGGLVARSACHTATISNQSWLMQLRKLVFLGTPHHGVPLEKGGNWLNTILDFSPYSAPFSRLGKIRSAGITDLRYGHIVDEDWQGRDRFRNSGDQRTPVPLPEGVDCYALAASTGVVPCETGNDLIGDGLVPVNSALGRHKNPDLNLAFPKSRQWIGRNMNHLDLLNHGAVYETVRNWLAA